MGNPKKIKLVVSDKKPEPQKQSSEVEVTLVDEKLNPGKSIAARLCGGTSTCIALMETE